MAGCLVETSAVCGDRPGHDVVRFHAGLPCSARACSLPLCRLHSASGHNRCCGEQGIRLNQVDQGCRIHAADVRVCENRSDSAGREVLDWPQIRGARMARPGEIRRLCGNSHAFVMKEPDLGTSLTYLPILVCGILMAGLRWKYLLVITAILVIALPIWYHFLK